MDNNLGGMEGNGDAEAVRWSTGGGGGGGSRGRGRGVRSAAQDDQPQLRRPHQPPTPAAEGASELAKKSSLSAEAAEFVPKSFAPPTQSYPSRNTAQDRLELARQSQNVPHVMLQRHPNQHQQHQHQQQHQQQQYYPQSGYHQQQQQQHHHQQQHHQQQHHHQQQQQQQHHYSSSGGYHANQQHHHQTYDYPLISSYSNFNPSSEEFIMTNADAAGQSMDLATCLAQLDNSMKTLTMNPGKFDGLIAHLVDAISPFLDQPEQCREIFLLILLQSINEGNFRYSGARLCTHLDTVAPATDKPTSIFRETLLNECKKKTNEQVETWLQMTKPTEDIEKKCHGLIFFLAELVTQMEAAPASDLGKLLIKLINVVLKNPAPTSAKNICQALKLAGQTLERDNSGNRAEMEQVMKTLSDLVIQGRVDVHVGRMVSSVSELRSGNWGNATSSSTGAATQVATSMMMMAQSTPYAAPQLIENQLQHQHQQQQQFSSGSQDEGTFYGPDGQVLTDEESRFLEAAAEAETMLEDHWENDEEDMVIAEAFEEFLKMPPNNNMANKNNIQTNNANDR